MTVRMNAERHLLANLTPVILKRGEIMKKQEKNGMCCSECVKKTATMKYLQAFGSWQYSEYQCHKESRNMNKNVHKKEMRPNWRKKKIEQRNSKPA